MKYSEEPLTLFLARYPFVKSFVPPEILDDISNYVCRYTSDLKTIEFGYPSDYFLLA